MCTSFTQEWNGMEKKVHSHVYLCASHAILKSPSSGQHAVPSAKLVLQASSPSVLSISLQIARAAHVFVSSADDDVDNVDDGGEGGERDSSCSCSCKAMASAMSLSNSVCAMILLAVPKSLVARRRKWFALPSAKSLRNSRCPARG